MPVTTAQCNMGTENYLDSAILLNYNDDDYSQVHGQIKEDFRAPTKHNILQPNISEENFRSSSDDIDIGYNIHSFDIG